MCDHWFNRIACPGKLRKISGCGRGAIGSKKGVCTCGAFSTSDVRINELIVDVSLQRRYDLYPYNGYTTLQPINFCEAYNDVCSKMLDHIQCPTKSRVINACDDNDDYTTWNGKCSCGDGFDVTDDRIAEDILDAFTRPSMPRLMIRSK